jgi:hypothetical protein
VTSAHPLRARALPVFLSLSPLFFFLSLRPSLSPPRFTPTQNNPTAAVGSPKGSYAAQAAMYNPKLKKKKSQKKISS